VANVWEEEALVDGDVGGILVGGGVSRALIGVPLPSHVRLTTLLLVVVLLLHLFLPFLVIIPVTITFIWTFSNIMTGLTTPVANPLGAGFVLLLLFLRICRKLLMIRVISSLLSLEATIGSLLVGMGSSFFSSVVMNANGLRLGSEGATLLQVDNVFGVFNHKLKSHTNLPITYSGDICSYLGFSRSNCT
jgi:hypothetical protein